MKALLLLVVVLFVASSSPPFFVAASHLTIFQAVATNDPKEIAISLQQLDPRQSSSSADASTSSSVVELRQPGSGFTPLIYAAAHGFDRSAAALLQNHGANPNAADDEGYKVVDVAAREGHANIVRMLHETGVVNINERNPYDRQTPIARACKGREERHAETVRVMVFELAARLSGEELEMTENPETRKVLRAYADL